MMLDKNELSSILSDWSYWNKLPPKTVTRNILKTTKSLGWSNDLVWVVQGVRRSGKSTLLSQIMQVLDLSAQQCFFINFEDPRLSGQLNYPLLEQVFLYAHEQVSNKRPLYFFFDEIQEVEGWEKWLHAKLERPGRGHFIVTGSNASLLGGELSTTLTGRHRTLELFPFDFQEYKTLKPEASLLDYLQTGGFPRPLQQKSLDEVDALLREYFRDIIERDVRRRVGVRSVETLIQLARAVYESTGSELSYRKLSIIMGVSDDTIKLYIQGFCDAYLCLPCSYFAFSERKRLVRPVKYYPIDLGLYRSVTTKTGEDLGKKLETTVYHLLRRKYEQVYYWREKNEVDFVVNTKEGILPIQVSLDEMKDRHKKGGEAFKKKFPRALDWAFINLHNVEKLLLTEK